MLKQQGRTDNDTTKSEILSLTTCLFECFCPCKGYLLSLTPIKWCVWSEEINCTTFSLEMLPSTPLVESDEALQSDTW